MASSYRVTAFNTATASTNKIHDDAVARQYGFGGGLVPGVDVYAYMTHPPAEAWGLDWLANGSMRARFLLPVYDGDEVTVSAVTADDRPMTIEVRRGSETCAVGAAALPRDPVAPPSPDRWSDVAPAADPPPATPETLQPGTALALAAHRFHADQAEAYLRDVREELPLYRTAGVAHPGWLLRDANYVLSANVVLGPWIHVESVVQHHAVARDGDTIEARATVTKQWEHKGHELVELDVALLHQDGLLAQVTHTAIFRPRSPERASA